MKKHLFPENGKFYKANMHCHTVLSDGNLTAQEVKEAYLAHGYSVVAFTDHEALLDHSDLTDERFIALNGYETAIKQINGVSTLKATTMPVHHINFIKKKPHDTVQFCFFPANFTPGRCKEHLPFLSYVGEICEYEYTADFFKHLTDEAHKNGCLVHYNHPRWSLQTANDLLGLEGFDGLEIMNTGCRYHGDFDASIYEELLRAGKTPYIVGGDDNHNGGKSFEDSFGGFTMICAESFTYEGMTDALEKGNAYVSSGPEIRAMYVEDGQLIVRTSPAQRIMIHTKGRSIKSASSQEGYLDSAVFDLTDEKIISFFRVEIIDKNGEHAYTRAYRVDDYVER